MGKKIRDWPRFLRKLERHLFEIADEYEIEWLEERQGSLRLTREPATLESIEKTQERLGCVFPDSYREFLLQSDGLEYVAGFPHGICTLSGVEELQWFLDADRGTGRLSAWSQEEITFRRKTITRQDFEDTLMIGESDGNECIVLDVKNIRENGECDVWLFDPEGGYARRASFESMMEKGLTW